MILYTNVVHGSTHHFRPDSGVSFAKQFLYYWSVIITGDSVSGHHHQWSVASLVRVGGSDEREGARREYYLVSDVSITAYTAQ